VKLLYTCEDLSDIEHPFSLLFELLEEGCLAEYLLPEGGGGPAQPKLLTPLQRIDAALGIAQGLAYLHGLKEEREVEGAEGAPGLPLVHRDVKSANVGFTKIGGELYVKIMDCGLAKAINGSGGGGGGGVSFTSGVVGTPGYMAPELADGEYTMASEIFSLGVILLELFTGRRAGTKTATKMREAVEDDGLGALTAVADAIWPPLAAQTLATLVSHCIQARPKKRPQTMAPVIEALKACRVQVLPGGGEGAAPVPQPTMLCPVCYDEVIQESGGLWCKGSSALLSHFICKGCFQHHVMASTDADRLSASGFGVRCCVAGCASEPWKLEELGGHLDGPAAVAFALGLRRALADLPAIIAAREAERKRREEEGRAAAQLVEKVRLLRLLIVEEDLTLHCPRCQLALVDWDGCAALKCRDNACGIAFCGVCLERCGNDAHEHVKKKHGGYHVGLAERNAVHKELRTAKLIARCAGLDRVTQIALVGELGKVDLPGVGISVQEIADALGIKIQNVEGQWECTQCTFTNSAEDGVCSICMLKQPPALGEREKNWLLRMKILRDAQLAVDR